MIEAATRVYETLGGTCTERLSSTLSSQVAKVLTRNAGSTWFDGRLKGRLLVALTYESDGNLMIIAVDDKTYEVVMRLITEVSCRLHEYFFVNVPNSPVS